VGINAALPAGQALLDLTTERVAEKLGIARAAATAAGRDPETLRCQLPMLSVAIGGGRPWVSSLAAGTADPAVLAASPVVLHGSVESCVEALQHRREELGIDYIHLGGDPAAAAPVVARLAGT
jgi:hypothetical protein